MSQNKINGILLVDKPIDKTSNAVLQTVKRLFGAKKAGHTGSLDPLATGMLPIFFGEATKFCQYLLDADKYYETTGCLGIKTDTSDSKGDVISSSSVDVVEDHLLHVLDKFKGEILQTPSMFSALKLNGKPLYHYARTGQTVERKSRYISIKSLQLKGFNSPLFDLEVLCSKGTYIRNLVEDIGDALNVGAHVTRLRRRYCGGFENVPMYTIDYLVTLTESERLALLMPVEAALLQFQQLTLTYSEKQDLQQGKLVQLRDDKSPTDYRLYDETGIFFGLGTLTSDYQLKAKRLLSY